MVNGEKAALRVDCRVFPQIVGIANNQTTNNLLLPTKIQIRARMLTALLNAIEYRTDKLTSTSTAP